VGVLRELLQEGHLHVGLVGAVAIGVGEAIHLAHREPRHPAAGHDPAIEAELDRKAPGGTGDPARPGAMDAVAQLAARDHEGLGRPRTGEQGQAAGGGCDRPSHGSTVEPVS
jgi:hypothetical protein